MEVHYMLGGTLKASGATGEFMSAKFPKAEMGAWLIEPIILYSSAYSQGLGLIIAGDMLTPPPTPQTWFSHLLSTEII